MDPDVKDDVNRKAEEHEPLPDLLINGYYLLGKDWLETSRAWISVGHPTPPVIITVANRTETAARIKYAFDHKKIRIDELCIPDKILHIDSKVIREAEEKSGASEVETTSDEDDTNEPTVRLSRVERAELLRQTVDTIGKVGKPGEQIHKVISVGMLSEGWDAKTVTHIMGLRAFSSQLLCEQVVGRGLRRTSYEVDPETNFFSPEYVNIFGVPFTFLPHETVHGPPPAPPTAKTAIEPLAGKIEYEISWPSIKKISPVIRPKLSLDIDKVRDLELNVFEMRTLADLAPVIDGKPDISKIKTIDLESLAKKFRLQRIIFETAGEVFDQMKPDWKGDKNYLLIQIIKIVEKFIESDKIKIVPALFGKDDLRRRLSLTLNMNKIVHHIWEAIRFENSETLVPIFDEERPIRSTGDMRTWYTGKPCEHTIKSHINMCVLDSTWEASEAFELDRNDKVTAWVKNDHLGFEILYIFEGTVHKYYPDFIIKLTDGTNLIMETKGQDSLKDKTKRAYLDEWVKAINEHGGFGKWEWTLSTDPADVKTIIGNFAR
jgi:type III restriction enzyme